MNGPLLDMFKQSVLLAIVISAIPLLCALTVGMIISVFQAATQIQEQTLSFVPKVAVVLLALYFAGPRCVEELKSFVVVAIEKIPAISRER